MPVPFWLPLCFAPATPPHCPLTPLPASDQTTPQVTALMAAPFLMDHPAAASIFPADAIARARKMYKMFGGALGAYTDSRGNAGVRQVRSLVWPGGARLGLAWLGLAWRGLPSGRLWPVGAAARQWEHEGSAAASGEEAVLQPGQ